MDRNIKPKEHIMPETMTWYEALERIDGGEKVGHPDIPNCTVSICRPKDPDQLDYVQIQYADSTYAPWAPDQRMTLSDAWFAI